ncbi:MAG: hypothetical protein ACKO0Z_10385 [Betaproteobacteria bacterium]
MTSRITFLLILIALGMVGTFDYENAADEESAYCDRLKNKVHTDYNNLKRICVANHWSK